MAGAAIINATTNNSSVRSDSKEDITKGKEPAMNGGFERVDSVMVDDDDNSENHNVNDSATTTTMHGAKTTGTTPEIGPAIATPAPSVRVLKPNEYKAAAACLAEAFAEDAMAMYFVDVPDRENWTQAQKWALHVRIMEYVTYAHLLKGLVVAAGPGYDCVALWMPPGKNMDDLLTVVRSGMWRLNFDLSREGSKRFFGEFLPLLHDTKASVLGVRDPQSWYLVYVGTRPSARGKGLAKAVVEHVTRGAADAAGRACYLESTNPANRGLYGRLGFVPAKTIYLQRGKTPIELDIMVREPVKKP